VLLKGNFRRNIGRIFLQIFSYYSRFFLTAISGQFLELSAPYFAKPSID